MRIPTNREVSIILVCIVIATFSFIIIIYAISPSWEYEIRGSAYSVSISSNGEYIVAGSGRGSVYLFQHSSSNPIRCYNTYDEIDDVDISADGKYIVAGGDYRLYLFNASSDTPLWTYDAQIYISKLIISGDGNYIAMTDIHDMLYVFHRSSSVPLWNETQTSINSIDISFDGSIIITCGDEITLFNSSTSTPLWTNNPTSFMYEASLSSDGRYACVCAEARLDLPTIYTFQTNNSHPIWNYTSAESIKVIDFSADGNYIITGGLWGTLHLFDRNSASPLFSYKTESRLIEVCISDNGDFFAVGANSDQIIFFKRGNAFPLWSFPTDGPLLSIDMSSDGNYLCTSVYYSTIALINKDSPRIFGDKVMRILIFWSVVILFMISLVAIPIFKHYNKIP